MPKGVKHQRESVDLTDFSEKVKQLEAANAELRAKLEAAAAKAPIPTEAEPVPAIKDPVPAPPSPVTEDIERMRGMLGPGVWSVGAEIDQPKYPPNLTSLFGSVPVPDHVLAERERPPTQAEREARKVMGTELPLFSGNPTEWPLFISTYMQTTLAGGYSNRENSVRLKSCLKGAAFEAVSGSLLLPDAVPRVIETLQMLYGRPEILVQALFDKVRAVPAPRAEKLETLCDFTLAVRSFSDHLIAAGQRNHLENPVLLMELVAKLPAHVKLSWGHHLTTTQTPANLESLSKFLFEVAHSVAKVTLYNGYTEESRAAKDRSKNKSLCHTAAQQNTMMADNSPEHDSCESIRRVHCPPFASANSAVRTKGLRSNMYPMCPACENEKHTLMTCPVFTRMEVQDRFRVVNEKRLCSNCFRSDHFARSCKSTYACKHCSKRHHTMIHPGPSQRTEASPSGVNMLAAITGFPSSARESSPSCYTDTLLTTVMLIVIDVYGQEHMARALLDTGSQLNAMSERLCQMLHLPRKATDVTIVGVGSTLTQARQKVQTEIRSRLNDFNESIEFLVLNRVSSTPLYSNQLHVPSTFPLADPGFQTSRRIDMIIGGAQFYHFLREGRLRLANRTLLVETVLGWVVTGTLDDHTRPPSRTATCNAVTISSINEQLERFWRLEEISQNNYSVDEQRCEEYYQKTVSRDSTGRYIVRMPKNSDNDNPIGHSKPSAQRRFRFLEQKLHKDESLKLQYHQFMREYASLGHMAPVLAEEENNPGAYYLPHHPVVEESSTTTKVRVVFDGSSKTSSGRSLNDSLLVGPIDQDELITFILRFRIFPIALVGDIEKMYRQILMHPSDRPLQRILWRFDSSHPIQTYELGTVTYGIAPSSFLATRTLLQLAEDEGAPFPKASVALRKHIYVDDLLSGEYSIKGAIQLRDELSELLQKGGFRMRKWCSNSLPVLSGLSPELLGTQSSLKFDPEESVKTLGLRWEPEADVFCFDISVTLKEQPPTKRSILSVISQLYDPLGIISPVVVQAKLIMQHLWLLALDWATKFPPTCNGNGLNSVSSSQASLTSGSNGLHSPQTIDSPKYTPSRTPRKQHMAPAYTSVLKVLMDVKVSLLASKSKVAPLKPLSISRLELCAALLAARLYEKVVTSLDLQFLDSFFWSDSTIVLHWMKAPPRTWKTFVANRISEIQATTHGSHWQHVSGKENPADMVSRGSSAEELICSELWMHGPLWLREDKSSWPSPIVPAEDITHEEEEQKQEVTEGTFVFSFV